jgi:DNA-binding SARP family transcriptional activator
MLAVQMLGVLSISVDGQRISDDFGPSCRRLSGFLFQFPGRVHRRERLAEEFWGHLEPDRARAALNTALWRLRKLLAREVQSSGGCNLRTTALEVTLEPAPWLDIDTRRFHAMVMHLLKYPGALESETGCRDLEGALATYRGPFLEGEDSDWILEERERLRSLYVRAGSELVRLYGRRARYEDGVSVARSILSTDSFRESLQRDLLILLVLNGQHCDALRHYERWSTLLRQELGVRPMPQTLQVVEDIRSGTIFERLEALRNEYFIRTDT